MKKRIVEPLQSGHPFTVYQGIDVALDGTGSRQHAQLLPGVPVTRSWSDKGDMIRQYFNTAAFLPPRAGSSRNIWEQRSQPAGPHHPRSECDQFLGH
jgi:hypothetical protein